MDLLNLDNAENKINNDLLDLDISSNQPNEPKNEQKNVKSFLGNLLDKVNNPHQQVSLSNKPIEDDFKTDMVLFMNNLGFYSIPGSKNSKRTLR